MNVLLLQQNRTCVRLFICGVIAMRRYRIIRDEFNSPLINLPMVIVAEIKSNTYLSVEDAVISLVRRNLRHIPDFENYDVPAGACQRRPRDGVSESVQRRRQMKKPFGLLQEQLTFRLCAAILHSEEPPLWIGRPQGRKWRGNLQS